MTFAKCEFEPCVSQTIMADSTSVKACTDLLPEMKPRYVMGIVRRTAHKAPSCG
jgi:hypothetical protein